MENNDNKKYSFEVSEEERGAAMEIADYIGCYFSGLAQKHNGEIKLGEIMDIMSYAVIMFFEASRTYAPQDPGNIAFSFAAFNYRNAASMTAEGRIGK